MVLSRLESGQLIEFNVTPHARRDEVTRETVNASIDFARAHGRRRLTLETTDRMRAAQALYQSMGFRWLGAREVAPGLSFQDYEMRLDTMAVSPVSTVH